MGKIKDEEVVTPTQGDRILVSSIDTVPAYQTKNLELTAIDDFFSSRKFSSVPQYSFSGGVAGSIRVDNDYIYVCIATNTWKRAAIDTW
jgi:hypothetical protein